MPRSWDQSSRKLISDLKETLRLYFRGARCYSEECDIKRTALEFSMPIDAEVYGGVVIKYSTGVFYARLRMKEEIPPLHSLPVSLPTRTTDLKMQIEGALHSEPAQVEDATVLKISVITGNKTSIKKISILSHNIPIFMYHDIVNAFKPAVLHSIGEFRISSMSVAGKLILDKFRKPFTHGTSLLKGRVFRLPASRYLLPIQRKPIPPHRFSKENRLLFRELLAQKAKLSVMDMKLVAVYDRVFLGMYQSISQDKDGSLLCIPRAKTDPQLKDRELTPVYLIIGQSAKETGKSYQVILPMKDLAHD